MMDELRKKHRLEQKDLQSRIAQKKRSATKKTRKGVNDECAELERELQERQEVESNACGSTESTSVPFEEEPSANVVEDKQSKTTDGIIDPLKTLSISTPAPTTNGHAKKPNRQKARLARRAAEQETSAEQAQKEASDLPNLRDQERQTMQEAYASRGLKEHEIRSDGHCLYAAVADQLQHSRVGLKPKGELRDMGHDHHEAPVSQTYKVTRQVAAAYISQNSDDFVPFLEEPLDAYVKTIVETGEWGGHLEILALAKAYGVDFNVLQGDGSVQTIECGLSDDHPELWLAYYRHSFGLGEHYNSLRQAD